MIIRRIVPITLLAALCLAVPARAADPTRVAFANTFKIYNDIQEKKELESRFADKMRMLNAEVQNKKAARDTLAADRDRLKPETTAYTEANDKVLKADIDYRIWAETNQADVMRQRK